MADNSKKAPVFTYEVIDPRDGKRMGKYQSKKAARAAVDRLDNQYGAYRYKARAIQAAA